MGQKQTLHIQFLKKMKNKKPNPFKLDFASFKIDRVCIDFFILKEGYFLLQLNKLFKDKHFLFCIRFYIV